MPCPATLSSARAPRSSTRARSPAGMPLPSSSTSRTRPGLRQPAAVQGAARTATAPLPVLERVVHEVAGKLQEVTHVDRVGRAWRDVERHRHALVRVDLGQRRSQLFERRLHREVDEGRAAAAHDSPLQLMLDDVLHAFELRRECCRRCFPAVEQSPHRRQRRLEAVCKIAERRAVALQPLALADQQRVEVAGDAGQFARPARAERLAPARLDIHDLGLEPSQRPECDAQRNRESAEQQEPQQQEPGDDAGPHAQQLLVPGLEALRRADDEICSRSLPGSQRMPSESPSTRVPSGRRDCSKRRSPGFGSAARLRPLPTTEGDRQPPLAPVISAYRPEPGVARRGSARFCGTSRPSAPISAVEISAMTCASRTSSSARRPRLR